MQDGGGGPLGRAAPPPPPEPDDRGIRFTTRVSAARRRLVRRVLLVPLVLLVAEVIAFIVLGVVRPTADGPLIPEPFDDLLARAPGILADLDPLQIALLPFILMGLFVVWRGVRYSLRTSQAVLTINESGRLVQTDGWTEHVDLDHLLDVDVAPNRAFTDLNERTPVGSPVVLRLRDATGGIVDVNPGMWEHEEQLVDIVRHYVWHGRAAVTADAARLYGLPVRYRHGEAAPTGGVGPDGSPPHSEDEREAAVREGGIDLRRLDPGPDGSDLATPPPEPV